MLKLDKSKDNTLALHLATEDNLSLLVLDYTQDYDRSSGEMFMNVDSTKGQYRIGTLTQNYIPSFSGLYTIDIYKGTTADYRWGFVAEEFGAVAVEWGQAGTGKIGEVLRTIRAIVSGSNNPEYTDYTSPNELGTYTTYNG